MNSEEYPCSGVYKGKAAPRWPWGNAMKRVLRVVGGALLALVLAGCNGSSSGSTHSSDMELKLYTVPVQESSSIQNALEHVLAGSAAGDGKGIGMRVTQPFPGTLMVLAPESIQDNVSRAIAALDKASAKVAAPGRLQVHFWVIHAIPGKGEDSPALQPLAKTLNTLRTSLGPSHFSLESTVSAATTFDERGHVVTGDMRKFEFTIRPERNDAIDLEVDYSDPRDSGIRNLETTIATSPGQYVMLAQAPGAAASSPSDKTAAPSLLLLVARVDRIESAAH